MPFRRPIAQIDQLTALRAEGPPGVVGPAGEGFALGAGIGLGGVIGIRHVQSALASSR